MVLVAGFDIASEVIEAIGLGNIQGIREIHLHIVPDDVVSLEIIRYPSHDQIMDMTKVIKNTYVLISKEKLDKGQLVVHEVEDNGTDEDK